MSIKTFSISLLILLLLAGNSAVADDSAARELQALLQKAEALKGHFEQRLADRDGTLLQETEGWFVVQRPGNFYWETLPPYEQIVVSNASNLWVYDPDLEQVTVQRQRDNGQVSPAQLLSGELADLQQHYRVRLTEQGDRQSFTLEPLQEDSLFARLQVEYIDSTLEALSFEDNLGQSTTLTFSNIQVNPDIDPKLFQFDVPAGVDVIVDD